MTEEEKKLLEEIQKTVGQETIDVSIKKENDRQLTNEILTQYNSQLAVTDMVNQASEVRIESLLEEMSQYGQQNITQYTRKNSTEYSENFKKLYMYCSILPQQIQSAIMNGGEIPVPNVGVPDSEIMHMIEDWINRYLEKNYPEQNLQSNFIVPGYQKYDGDAYNIIYKPTDILKISIQKTEKTK